MVLFLPNREKKTQNKIGSVILNMIYKKKKYHQNKTKSSQEKSTNDVLIKKQKKLFVRFYLVRRKVMF